MAKTMTEFTMKRGMTEAIHNYLAGQGFETGELEGTPAYAKAILPVLHFLMARQPYYYVLILDAGDKIVVEEWFTMYNDDALDVDSFTMEHYFHGALADFFVCQKRHQQLIDFLNRL